VKTSSKTFVIGSNRVHNTLPNVIKTEIAFCATRATEEIWHEDTDFALPHHDIGTCGAYLYLRTDATSKREASHKAGNELY
jgi:hypothetical protein